MATLLDIITRVRMKADDELSQRYAWQNEEIAKDVRDAVKEFCERTLCFEEFVDEDVCQLTIKSGEQYAELDPRVIRINRARLITKKTLVYPVTRQQMEQENPDWDILDAGTPNRAITNIQRNGVILVPTPNINDIMKMSVYRYTLEDVIWDNRDEDLEPPLDEDNLMHGTLYRMYTKQDSETFSDLAKTHLGLWTDVLNRFKKQSLDRDYRNDIVVPLDGAL